MKKRQKFKRYAAMKDGHWWSVIDLWTMKKVPCPLDYIRYYHYKKDAELVAKTLNYNHENSFQKAPTND